MVALWMCYATLVTALLVAGAWAVDVALTWLGAPRRWAWAVAVAGAIALPAGAAWRAQHPAPVAAIGPAQLLAVTVIRGSPAATRVALAPRSAGESLVADTPRPVAAIATRARALGEHAIDSILRTLGPLDGLLLAAWLLASVGGAAVVARGVWVIRRQQRAWRPAVVAGEHVWLSQDVGPALVGAWRPRVVLPSWLTATIDADALGLVLAHERAHAAARDPLLLACALVALVCAPWNAALWIATRQLRLAVEADCDRRVLRAHPDARRYARVLVDVAARVLGGAGARVLATALLDPPGLLERRVEWLLGAQRGAGAGRPARAAGAAVGGLGVVVLACGVPHPAPRTAPALRLAIAERVLAAQSVRLDRGAARMDRASARMNTAARRLDRAAARMASIDADRVVPPAPDPGDDALRHANARQLAALGARLDSVARARQARFDGLGRTIDSIARARQLQLAQLGRVRALAGDETAARARLVEATTRNDAARVRFDAVANALREQLARQRVALRGRVVRARAQRDADWAAIDRTIVMQAYPAALTGGLGRDPFVWAALDAEGAVSATALGPEGMGIGDPRFPFSAFDAARAQRVAVGDSTTGRRLVLDRTAIRRRFPTLTDAQVGSYRWSRVPAGRDTINLIVVSPHAAR